MEGHVFEPPVYLISFDNCFKTMIFLKSILIIFTCFFLKFVLNNTCINMKND